MSQPPITHVMPSESILQNIRNCATAMSQRLGIESAESASEIVEAVNQEIHRQQKEGHHDDKAPEDPMDTEPLCLGSLWGEQLVAKLGWEWVMLSFHEHGSRSLGVSSPDRAWIICPFEFVYGCLVNDVTPTVSLSFNMLDDGTRIPDMAANSYENLMAGVRHIIPPG